MDRSWMSALRTSKEHEDGVEEFIEFTKKNAYDKSGKYFCPCVNCLNGRRSTIDGLRDHLFCEGINLRYTRWIWHGERGTRPLVDEEEVVGGFNDRMHDMIHDVGLGFSAQSHINDSLQSDAEIALYPGCSTYTWLTAVLKLFNLKATNGWTDKSFTELLQLLGDMLPADNVLPNSVYEAKKILSRMGMGYEKIHACPNDCILYTEEYADLNECPKCGSSRYKVKKHKDSSDDGDANETTKGQPLKVLWYLSIIPRFKGLFANAIEAKKMTWHVDEKISDGKYLRHLADSPQWKKINEMYPEFGSEPRNLRLGLCMDGINPYGTLNNTHSAWLVLLVIYNLPPWLSMRCKYMMLSMMISGPKQPGINIDVYLAPLIKDLKKLWEEGVDVFDAHKQESFKLHVIIFTTINDFLAYGNLRFLDRFHPYRRLKKVFNGTPEHGLAPKPLTGEEVYRKVERIDVVFGKTKDGINARLDLAEMGIRERLHLQLKEGSKRVYLEPAAHTLSKAEKTSLCRCLHNIKVPQGYSSNMKKLVSMDDLKLVGMKSHDYHVLMQQLLPVAIRAEEAIDFCKGYLSGVEAQARHDDRIGKGTRGLKVKSIVREELFQVHLYILNNMKEVQPYLDNHKQVLKDKYPKKSDRQIANEHNKIYCMVQGTGLEGDKCF
ncbi:uncharacterized protein LOC114757826 [Neltuma alba]|uniref:uncharacterized protein LOC114757826 n=1 Tax=Neltuma alba TaxID=207710 RepID=UPI0010A5220E|nr:uncharacterized protein LOC114757826 [Prosopis alba]